MASPITCPGFKCSGLHAGLKKNALLDLGLICSDVPAQAAGVFTRNKVQAAPVLVTSGRIAAHKKVRAIIVNSGNANCCTGPQGLADAEEMAAATARQLDITPDEVLVASTGVIGLPLPMDKISAAVSPLVDALDENSWPDLAQAILTTDLVPKMASQTAEAGGRSYSIIGIAKGSGMIRPDMATMLCFICTDADIAQPDLQRALLQGTQRSFNRITVDGDTSTNDMVLVLANGLSGARIATQEDLTGFEQALNLVLLELAKAVVKDGEGATKLMEINVYGADTDASAMAVADTIANSNLVKTALFGEDANWGRILAAAGRAGVPLQPEKVDLAFDDVWVVKNGLGLGPRSEQAATRVLKQEALAIHLHLHLGSGRALAITCDFSYDYVKINADYRS